MNTPIGFMEGSYEMITPEGQGFKVMIPQFRLAVPGVLH
jgi:ApaG protein